ncbi:MAG: molybdenum ABC transporter ATP-binding protein [Betaproteobacteria bacterium]|nr:molybdenum ABC transporter ATP-binding protein [Betaproteobacteria bacterium]
MSIHARFLLDHGDFCLDADFTLPGRGVSVLFGSSGSGKTSILRAIAGLEPAARGALEVNGVCWQDDEKAFFLPTHQRGLGMVFQEASLFAHLDVRRNLEYGFSRTPPQERRIGWDQAVEWMGIGHLLERRAQMLSGGERQRVAIARALLASPSLLLLDEPLTALDFRRKQEILPYLENLQRELDIPLIYVSHALEEVVRLADYLLLVEAGKVAAGGAPAEILSRLDLPAGFAEEAGTVIEARMEEIDTRDRLARLAFAGGELWAPLTPALESLPTGAPARIRIHARDVSIALSEHVDSSILNRFPAIIESSAPAEHPAHMLLRLSAAGTPIVARITRRSHEALGLRPGLQVWLQIKAVALV